MTSGIDFSKKIRPQRYYDSKEEPTDKFGLIRIFESDRGRIVNSAAIRRLQQKTQVFPLERNAAVRSRLTHSLEVQQVGRHIVREIVERLERSGDLQRYGMSDFLVPMESIVEMACLMHDIGNPPFGHFGEEAINRWFRERLLPNYCDAQSGEDPCQVAFLRLDKREVGLDALRMRVRRDLCQFEGNAQGIRLVHSLQKLNLTYSQTACILKYTRPAYWNGPVPPAYGYLAKKPGYYLSEESYIFRLRKVLEMGEYQRFPLTYIMEAADDISYCIADLEDAVEKEILTVKQLYAHLLKAWGKRSPGDLFDRTVGAAHRKMQKGSDRRSDSDQFFMYLRVFTVASLVPYAAERFIRHLPEIFHGTLNEALLEDGSAESTLLNVFKQVAFEHVFNYAEVEQLELQGERVINGLLNIYSPILEIPRHDFAKLVENNAHRDYSIATRLWHKLSMKHRLAYVQAISELKTLLIGKPEEYEIVWEYYYRARLIQDYISGMTDLYAYDEYRRLMVAE